MGRALFESSPVEKKCFYRLAAWAVPLKGRESLLCEDTALNPRMISPPMSLPVIISHRWETWWDRFGYFDHTEEIRKYFMSMRYRGVIARSQWCWLCVEIYREAPRRCVQASHMSPISPKCSFHTHLILLTFKCKIFFTIMLKMCITHTHIALIQNWSYLQLKARYKSMST